MSWHRYTGSKERLDVGDGKTISAKRAYVDENGDYHTRRQYIKHTTGSTPEQLVQKNQEKIQTAIRSGQLIPYSGPDPKYRTGYINTVTGEQVTQHGALESIRVVPWQPIEGSTYDPMEPYLGTNNQYAPLVMKFAVLNDLDGPALLAEMQQQTPLGLQVQEVIRELEQLAKGDLTELQKSKLYKRVVDQLNDLGLEDAQDYHDAFYA